MDQQVCWLTHSTTEGCFVNASSRRISITSINITYSTICVHNRIRPGNFRRKSKKSQKIFPDYSNMAEGRAKGKRQALSTSAVHRDLLKGAGGDFRVSDKAVSAARGLLKKKLVKLGEKSRARLDVAKRSTLNDSRQKDYHDVEAVVGEWKDLACLVSEKMPRRGKDETRGLTQAGVLRVFGQGIPLGRDQYRISKESAEKVLMFAESFVYNLGRHASAAARNRGAKTISEKDIEFVADLFFHM